MLINDAIIFLTFVFALFIPRFMDLSNPRSHYALYSLEFGCTDFYHHPIPEASSLSNEYSITLYFSLIGFGPADLSDLLVMPFSR